MRMDALRRISSMAVRDGIRRRVRVRPAGSSAQLDPGRIRLRGPGRRLMDALNQLQAGVPLNWGQIEDDAELVTLARLQGAAREARDTVSGSVPPSLKFDLFNRLAPRLPQPRPQPVQAAPKPLAGFSENVPVVTQAEENVPALSPTTALWIGSTVASGIVVLVAMWVLGAAIKVLTPPPTYSWIDVRQAGTPVANQQLPSGTLALDCLSDSAFGGAGRRNFLSAPSMSYAQEHVGFPIVYVPLALSSPLTYTLRLRDVAVDPCGGEQVKPADRGAVVKLEYQVRYEVRMTPTPRPTPLSAVAATSIAERGLVLDTVYQRASGLVVFQSQQQTLPLDVSTGSWKPVRIGDIRGVYWRGGPYTDMAGTQHIGDVSVMVIERGDVALTMVGRADSGITEDMLAELVRQVEGARLGSPDKPGAQFTWIEMRQGEQVISPRRASIVQEGPACQTFRYAGGSPTEVQPYVGYPMLSLPESMTISKSSSQAATNGTPSVATPTPERTQQAVTTYTMSLAEVFIRSCSDTFPWSDPSAAVKMRYVMGEGDSLSENIRMPDLVMFQTRQLPATIDVRFGAWKEVWIGEAHGIYWTGTSFRDMEGIEWTPAQDSGEVRVLMVEREDMVITLISRGAAVNSPIVGMMNRGITEQLLIELASRMK